MASGYNPSFNSNKLHSGDNSKTALPTTKTNVDFPKESKIPINSKYIYAKRGFCGENKSTPDEGSANGEAVEESQATETEEEMTSCQGTWHHQGEEEEERKPERKKKRKNHDESKSKL